MLGRRFRFPPHGHPEVGAPRRRMLRITRWDVGVAMVIAMEGRSRALAIGALT